MSSSGSPSNEEKNHQHLHDYGKAQHSGERQFLHKIVFKQ